MVARGLMDLPASPRRCAPGSAPEPQHPQTRAAAHAGCSAAAGHPANALRHGGALRTSKRSSSTKEGLINTRSWLRSKLLQPIRLWGLALTKTSRVKVTNVLQDAGLKQFQNNKAGQTKKGHLLIHATVCVLIMWAPSVRGLAHRQGRSVMRHIILIPEMPCTTLFGHTRSQRHVCIGLRELHTQRWYVPEGAGTPLRAHPRHNSEAACEDNS